MQAKEQITLEELVVDSKDPRVLKKPNGTRVRRAIPIGVPMSIEVRSMQTDDISVEKALREQISIYMPKDANGYIKGRGEIRGPPWLGIYDNRFSYPVQYYKIIFYTAPKTKTL